MSATSFYTEIALGVQSIVSGLTLPNTPQVGLWKFPTDRPAAGVVLPSTQITLPPVSERFVGGLNKSDDWEYPYLLTFLEANNQDFSWDTDWLVTRRQVELAFHNKRPLPSMPTNPYFRVEPRVVVDAGMIHDDNLNIGQLLLWARQREDRQAAPTATPLPGGDAVFSNIGEAIQAAIQSLELAGIFSTQVLLQKVWSDRQVVKVDLSEGAAIIVATSPEPEKEVGPMNARDDWVWPALVTVLRASDQDTTPNLLWDDTWFFWRQLIRNAFHNQRLAAVGTSWNCTVEPKAIIDAGPFREQNVDIGQLLVRCRTREVRG